jgi:hypothetical protein
MLEAKKGDELPAALVILTNRSDKSIDRTKKERHLLVLYKTRYGSYY